MARRTWLLITGPPTITALAPDGEWIWRADFPYGGHLEVAATIGTDVPERELKRLAVCWHHEQLARLVRRAPQPLRPRP